MRHLQTECDKFELCIGSISVVTVTWKLRASYGMDFLYRLIFRVCPAFSGQIPSLKADEIQLPAEVCCERDLTLSNKANRRQSFGLCQSQTTTSRTTTTQLNLQLPPDQPFFAKLCDLVSAPYRESLRICGTWVYRSVPCIRISRKHTFRANHSCTALLTGRSSYIEYS